MVLLDAVFVNGFGEGEPGHGCCPERGLVRPARQGEVNARGDEGAQAMKVHR